MLMMILAVFEYQEGATIKPENRKKRKREKKCSLSNRSVAFLLLKYSYNFLEPVVALKFFGGIEEVKPRDKFVNFKYFRKENKLNRIKIR